MSWRRSGKVRTSKSCTVRWVSGMPSSAVASPHLVGERVGREPLRERPRRDRERDVAHLAAGLHEPRHRAAAPELAVVGVRREHERALPGLDHALFVAAPDGARERLTYRDGPRGSRTARGDPGRGRGRARASWRRFAAAFLAGMALLAAAEALFGVALAGTALRTLLDEPAGRRARRHGGRRGRRARVRLRTTPAHRPGGAARRGALPDPGRRRRREGLPAPPALRACSPPRPCRRRRRRCARDASRRSLCSSAFPSRRSCC